MEKNIACRAGHILRQREWQLYVGCRYHCEICEVNQRKDVHMNFGQALELLKKGQKVARMGWNGKGMFLFLVPGSTFKVNRPPLLGIYPEGTEISYRPHIDLKGVDDSVSTWNPTCNDVLAEDWVIA